MSAIGPNPVQYNPVTGRMELTGLGGNPFAAQEAIFPQPMASMPAYPAGGDFSSYGLPQITGDRTPLTQPAQHPQSAGGIGNIFQTIGRGANSILGAFAQGLSHRIASDLETGSRDVPATVQSPGLMGRITSGAKSVPWGIVLAGVGVVVALVMLARR